MPSHLSFELLRLAEDGEIPLQALQPVVSAHGGSPATARDSDHVARCLRGWRRREEPASHLATALGLVPEEVVAPAEEAAGKALLARLRVTARDRRLAILLKNHRLVRSSPALLAALLKEARERLSATPEEGADWLELAREVLLRLRRPSLPPSVLAESELRFLAHEANLLRVQGDLPAAAERFEAIARDPRRRQIYRLEVHAELWRLEASLRTDLRHFDAAHELLDHAECIYQALSHRELQVRTLLKKSNVLDYAGRAEEALEVCRRAADLVDRSLHSALFWQTQHNLADSLVNLGRIDEAIETLAQARPYFKHCDEPSNRVRLKWLDAKIVRAQGHLAVAALRMRRVAQDCLDLELEYDAALAFLDLAEIRLSQGKTSEVKWLTEAMDPVFRSKQVHREATAALLLFREAANAERVDAALVHELRRYLLLARNDRDFTFRPGVAVAPEAR